MQFQTFNLQSNTKYINWSQNQIQLQDMSLQNNYEDNTEQDYQKQIKQYSIKLLKQREPLQRLILQTLISTVQIHLGNYNQSYERLKQTESYLQAFQNQLNRVNHKQKVHRSQILLLKIKVCTNFIIIELINCQQKLLFYHLQQLLKVIDNIKTIKSSQQSQQDLFFNNLFITCFQTALNNIYGFSSFQEIDSYCLSCEQIGSQNQRKSYGIIYSTLSLLKQLTNKNINSALQLELIAFSKYKTQKNKIMMTVSLKHIIQISKKLNLPKQKVQIYEQAFKTLLNSKQLKGLLQQTIFRNFQEKIELGVKITQILIQFQKKNINPLKFNKRKTDRKWMMTAIRYRLRQSLNEANKKQITSLLQMTETNPSQIIDFLSNNSFVKNAVEQYRDIVQVLINQLQKLTLNKLSQSFYALKLYFDNNQNKSELSNSLQIQIVDIKKIQKSQKQENISPNKGSKMNSQQQFLINGERSLNYSQQQYNHLPFSNINNHRDKKQQKLRQSLQIPNQNYQMKQTSKFYVQPSPLGSPLVLKSELTNHKVQKSPKRNNKIYKSNSKSIQQKQHSKKLSNVVKKSPKKQIFAQSSQIQNPTYINSNYVKKEDKKNMQKEKNLSHSKNQVYLQDGLRTKTQVLMDFLKTNQTSQADKNNQYAVKFNLNKTPKAQVEQEKFQNGKVLQKQYTKMSKLRQNYQHQQQLKKQDSDILGLSNITSRTKKSISPKIPKQSTIKIHKQPAIIKDMFHIAKTFKNQQKPESTISNKNNFDSKISSANQQTITYNQWVTKTISQNKPIQTRSKLQSIKPTVFINQSQLQHSPRQKIGIRKTQSFDNLSPKYFEVQNQSEIKNRQQISNTTFVNAVNQNQKISKNNFVSVNNPKKITSTERIQEKQKQMSMSKQKYKLLNKSSLGHKKQKHKKRFQDKIKHIIKLCHFGQYVDKRFQTSDGGDQRFLRISQQNNYLQYANDESKVLSSGSRKQCKLCHYKDLIEDIRGVIYGKITNVFLKECNKKLQAHKCFSVILAKHTLNFHCVQQKDIEFWLPGISYCLQHNRKQLFSHKKYSTQIQKFIKKQKNKHQSDISQDLQRRIHFYSVGKILWKRVLLKLQAKYIGNKLKKQHKYINANAYAIKKFGQDKFGMSFKKQVK